MKNSNKLIEFKGYVRKYSGRSVLASGQKGFSMMELVVIISIIGVISAIAIPNLMSMRSRSTVRSDARDVASFFRLAQTVAIKRNTTVGILFDNPSAGRYLIFSDDDADGTQDFGEFTTHSRALNTKCVFANSSFPGGTPGYDSRGRPTRNGAIATAGGRIDILSTSADVRYRINVSIAGKINVQVSTDGGGSWN